MNGHPAPRSAGGLRIVLALAGLAVLAASGLGIYLATGERRPASEAGPPQPLREPRPVPELRFQDARGKPMSLADFRGKVVLLNLWATWCTPCRIEMPALDRVQQQLGGPGFEVVALSIDRGGPDAVRPFYDEIGIRALAIYVDPSTEAMTKLKAIGIPTTLLIDREGRELWRKTGPAEWDGPQYVDALRRQIAAAAPTSGVR
jgi:thiol-disulfide isomerase/thioredoxin